MSNEVQSPNAAGVKNAVEQSDNLAFGMYAHQRKAAKAGVIGEPKIGSEVINAKVVQPVTQQEVEENRSQEAPENETSNAPKAESVNESEQQPAEESDVLSKSSKEIDLESMSEQDLRELAEKLGSRAVARYGELTAKRRQAEEQLNALKQELVKRDTQKDPLETKKIENNPFGDIDTVEKLQAKAKEVDEAIEWAEDILWHNEHLGAEDIVATIDGKDYTKAQVRKVMRDSQKARKDFLPAQLAEVNARQNRVAVKQQFSEAIKTELNWMQGDDGREGRAEVRLNEGCNDRIGFPADQGNRCGLDRVGDHLARSIRTVQEAASLFLGPQGSDQARHGDGEAIRRG